MGVDGGSSLENQTISLYLFHRNGWSPSLLRVEYAQTDSARRIDIRVEQRRVESAWMDCGIEERERRRKRHRAL